MAETAAPQTRPPLNARVAKGTPLNRLQARLEVGPSGDHFEREADRVAGQVMQGGAASVSIPPSITPLGAQRKAALKPKEEEKRGSTGKTVQRKTLQKPEEEHKRGGRPGTAQRKTLPKPKEEEPKGAKPGRVQRDAAAGSTGGMAGAGVSSAIQAMQDGSAPGLDSGARGFMEGRFGRDFGGVRVHSGPRAAAAADALGARAFTLGQDIFFNASQYQPHSTGGRRLLAHELTHTVQQTGGAAAPAQRRVQRKVKSEDEKTKPAALVATGSETPAPSTFESKVLPGAKVDVTDVPGAKGKAKGTITVPTLGLPKFAKGLKGTAGGPVSPVAAEGQVVPEIGKKGLDFKAPMPRRDEDSVPAEVWTEGARKDATVPAGIKKALTARVTATPDAFTAKDTDGKQVYFFRLADGGFNPIFIGTLDELAASDALLRPQWSMNGKPLFGNERFDADHFLEMQIGGANKIENMWLLEASYNRSVGSKLANNMEADLTKIIEEAKTLITNDSEKPVSYPEVKQNWNITFSQVTEGTKFRDATESFWTLGQIRKGKHVEVMQPLTEAQAVDADLTLEEGQKLEVLRVFPSLGGGFSRPIKVGAKGNIVPPPATGYFKKGELFKGIEVISGTYTGNPKVAAGDRDLATLQVDVFKTEGEEVIDTRRGDVTVKSAPRLGVAGYLSRDSIVAAARTTRFKSLSPLTFSDIGITPEGVLSGTGTVGSTKLMLPGLNVPLRLYGDRIGMDFPVPTDNLSLGPVTVTEAGLSLGVGGKGFFVEGYAGFEVRSLGTGMLTATLTEAGPELSGNFVLAMDFLNPATVAATYNLANDTFRAEAALGVQEGRIPGVESGTVNVVLTRDTVSAIGTINLGGALRGAVVNVTYNETDGLRIGADNIPLPFANLPAVRDASLSISAERTPQAEGWSFAGHGSATLAVPGTTGTLAIDYLDGAVTIHGSGNVELGPASGTLDFTATNRQIDAEGRPIEGPLTDGLTAWGRGSVTVRLGEVLTGTAGVELTPDNRVIISGTIAMPPVYEVFARRDYTKDIFTLSPPEFPIWGVSVAGVGVGVFAFVDARVFLEAFVGPGEIRDAAVTATLDLDRPEDATVHGHGEFHVPAYAGLGLDVGGGLRARAAVAYAQGRVGLTGRLGVEAGAGAGVDIDWSRAAGLTFGADLHAEATPKFDLSATASVTVGVDLLVTEAEHTFGPWSQQLGSFGPDMTLGVSMPVCWSEAGGLDLSLDNIVITRPQLDAGALMSDVFARLAD